MRQNPIDGQIQKTFHILIPRWRLTLILAFGPDLNWQPCHLWSADSRVLSKISTWRLIKNALKGFVTLPCGAKIRASRTHAAVYTIFNDPRPGGSSPHNLLGRFIRYKCPMPSA